jgi:hypothetical protein
MIRTSHRREPGLVRREPGLRARAGHGSGHGRMGQGMGAWAGAWARAWARDKGRSMGEGYGQGFRSRARAYGPGPGPEHGPRRDKPVRGASERGRGAGPEPGETGAGRAPTNARSMPVQASIQAERTPPRHNRLTTPRAHPFYRLRRVRSHGLYILGSSADPR